MASQPPKLLFNCLKLHKKRAAYRMSDVKSLIYKNLRRLKIRTKDFRAKQLWRSKETKKFDLNNDFYYNVYITCISEKL